MGKYGSGVSMKTVIETEVAEVENILNKNRVPAEEKKAVLDALQEMAYQWCQTNAVFCAVDAFLKEEHPEVWRGMMAGFLKSDVYHATYAKKMADTLPDWQDGDAADEN